MKPTLSKQTIHNFFAGATTSLQKALVEEWLTEPANQELFFRWLEEWENDNPQFIPNADEAFQRVLSRQTAVPVSLLADAGGPPRRWLSLRGRVGLMAASIGLLLLAGGWFSRDWLLFETHTTGYGSLKTITLPDGSRVTLNANTSLRVPRAGFSFLQTNRYVELAGEAEFSVVHTRDNRRFVVHTPDDLNVEVLGTEFILYSRSRGSKVVLNRGKVSLRSGKTGATKPLIIAPGDVVTVSRTGQFVLQHRQPIALHAAWKQHGFVFDGTSVGQLATVLQENFGVTLLIPDPQLAQRTLGGTFQARRAEDLLQILTEVLDARVVRIDETTFSLNPNN